MSSKGDQNIVDEDETVHGNTSFILILTKPDQYPQNAPIMGKFVIFRIMPNLETISSYTVIV